jgi:hypothetical protein
VEVSRQALERCSKAIAEKEHTVLVGVSFAINAMLSPQHF